MRFEWDPVKAASNAKKHKVTFELAKTVFYDDFAVQFLMKNTPTMRIASFCWA
jgi:uncharacterized DUF497 family protein